MVARALRKFQPGEIKVTSALLKFCRQHGHSPFWIEQLELCLTALKQRDLERTTELVTMLSTAGMCSFLDWFPRVSFEHEDDEYVDAIWNALLGQWLETMSKYRKDA